MKYLITVIYCCLFLSCSFAQVKSHTALIGVGMLNSSYIGDLNYGEGEYFRAYPGICFSGQFEGKSHIQAQLNIGAGRFIEQYDKIRVRPRGEISPNNFVNTSFLYGDLRFKYRFTRSQTFQPYISVGFGALSFQPKDEEDYLLLPNTYSRPTQNTFSSIVPSMPVSAGFRVHCIQSIHLGLEYTLRFTASDYLDNIGKEGKRAGNDALQAISLILYFGTKPQLPLSFIDTVMSIPPKKLADSSQKETPMSLDSLNIKRSFLMNYPEFKIPKAEISADLAELIQENETQILSYHKWDVANDPYDEVILRVLASTPDGQMKRGMKNPPDTLRRKVSKLPQIKPIAIRNYSLKPANPKQKWSFKMKQHIKSGAFAGIDAMLMKDIWKEKEAMDKQNLREISSSDLLLNPQKTHNIVPKRAIEVSSDPYKDINEELVKDAKKEYAALNPPFLDRLPPLAVGLVEPRTKYAVFVPYYTLVEDGFNVEEERALLSENLAEYKTLIPEEEQGFIFPLTEKTEANDELAGLWAHLEEEALASNDWFYYTCKAGDDYDYLYKRFKVRKNIIQAANHLTGDLPQSGKIRIPDLRQWIEQNPEAGDLQNLIRELGAR